MATPTLSHAMILDRVADNDSPNDPNTFTLGEIATALADSAAVSSITSQVTSAAASGSLDSVPVSTADSKALSAATRASVADSKAVSGSVNTSVTDSKVLSVSVNTSIADSKGVSAAFFASMPSAITSTADSKGVSAGTRASIAQSTATSHAASGADGALLVSDGADWQRETNPSLNNVRVSRFAINKAVDAAVSIDLEQSVSTGVTEYGGRSSITQAGAGIAYGYQNRVDHSGSISSAAFDQRIRALAGSRDHIVGFQNVSHQASTGTLTWLYGYYNSLIISDSCGLVTNAASYYVVAPNFGTAGTTVTNSYAIYIEDHFTARATAAWAIYTVGVARSHFGGSVDTDGSFYCGGDAGIGVAFGAEVTLGVNVRTLDIRGSAGGGLRFGVSSGLTGRLFATSTYVEWSTASAVPLRFGTNSTDRGEWDANGNFVVGTAAIATTATNGFPYFPTCAGAPTGVPTAKTGLAPHVLDTTNGRAYWNYGGAWHYATLT